VEEAVTGMHALIPACPFGRPHHDVQLIQHRYNEATELNDTQVTP
jgi:hypothetical protein